MAPIAVFVMLPDQLKHKIHGLVEKVLVHIENPRVATLESLLNAFFHQVGLGPNLEPGMFLLWNVVDYEKENTQLIRSDAELADLLQSLSGGISRKGFFTLANSIDQNTSTTTKTTTTVAAATTDTQASQEPEQILSMAVNGAPLTIKNPSPTMLLVDFLRESLHLTGTKVGCGEGGCGACAVSVRDPSSDGKVFTINSCLRLLCACDGLEITTIEGFGSEKSGFSAVQQAIADGSGSQCGFCMIIPYSTIHNFSQS